MSRAHRVACWLVGVLLAGCNRQTGPSQLPSAEASEPSGTAESERPSPQGEPFVDETPAREDDAPADDLAAGGVVSAPPPVEELSEEESDEAYRRAAKRPIGVVMANAVYAPDPRPDKLDATKTGTTTRRPGESKVRFCVTPTGRTAHIKTTKAFYGDPEVDQLCEDTIRTWRFHPFEVAGDKIVMCSTAIFRIEFD